MTLNLEKGVIWGNLWFNIIMTYVFISTIESAIFFVFNKLLQITKISRSLVLAFNTLLWFGSDYYLGGRRIGQGGVTLHCFPSPRYKTWDLGFLGNSVFGGNSCIFYNNLFIEQNVIYESCILFTVLEM